MRLVSDRLVTDWADSYAESYSRFNFFEPDLPLEEFDAKGRLFCVWAAGWLIVAADFLLMEGMLDAVREAFGGKSLPLRWALERIGRDSWSDSSSKSLSEYPINCATLSMSGSGCPLSDAIDSSSKPGERGLAGR
jgi:hypothetical protein